MDYDVIVVGAGNGGLVASNYMALNGKRVLLLEQQVVGGGLSSTFRCGRFEFDIFPQYLCDYGSYNNVGYLRELFKELGIDNRIEFCNVQEAFRVIALEPEMVDYTMPFGINNFINKMDEYVPGSRNAMLLFFNLAKECRDALEYLGHNSQKNLKGLKKRFSNFLRVAPYSLKDIFYMIEMPVKAQGILNACWMQFGVSESHLSFVQYAVALLSYIDGGAVVPKLRNYDISLTLEERLKELGGVVKHNALVNEIIMENDKVTGVALADGQVFKASEVIADVSPTKVYGKMIKAPTNLDKENAFVNYSNSGVKQLNIYLGLNRSKEELGLKDYTYYIYHSLNSDEEYQRMSQMDNDTMVVTCLNRAIPDCSPLGTTILNISTLYFGDCFDKAVTSENYFNLKNEIATRLIERFETATSIKIKDFIEEIEVATPVTYAWRFGNYQGNLIDYATTDSNSVVGRMMSMDEEPMKKGLHFCGSNSVYGSGVVGTYFSGKMAAEKTLQEMQVKDE